MKVLKAPNRRPFHLVWCAVLGLTFGSLGWESAAAVEADKRCLSEPKDTLIAYGDLVFCTLDRLTDEDTFRWHGKAGEQVFIRAKGLSGGIEPCFRVFDPAGDQIDGHVCSASNPSNQQSVPMLTQDGTYTMIVGDGGSNETGDFRVILERIVPPSPTARPIADFGLVETGAIDLLGDVDLYLFTSEGDGDTIESEARGLTGGIEPCLWLYAPAGGPAVAMSCSASNPATQVIKHGLAGAGTYVVLVDDGGVNEVGNYELSVRCLFGECPPAAASDYIDITSLDSFSGNLRPELAGLRLERKARADGRVGEVSRVVFEDGATGRVVGRIRLFGNGWQPKAIAALPDLPSSANGVGEVVVLAVSVSGRTRFRIKDALSGELLGNVRPFNSDWDPRNMATVPDRNGDGVPDIVVVAVNKADGRALARIFDPVTGVRLKQFRYPLN